MPRPVTLWSGDADLPVGPRVPVDRARLYEPVAESMAGLRDTQADFETPAHSVAGASTTLRPDAVSLDYQTAHTLGPVAYGDTTEGLVAVAWRARHEAVPGGGRVLLTRASEDGTSYDEEGVLFEYLGAPIVELDVAFEQLGQPVIVASRLTGAGGASEVWVYWYDPAPGAFVFAMLGPGRTPRCLLDDPVNPENSDILLFYINEGAGDTGAVCYRQQRDRYEIENVTPIVGEGLILPASIDRNINSVGPIIGPGVYDGVAVEFYADWATVPGASWLPSNYPEGWDALGENWPAEGITWEAPTGVVAGLIRDPNWMAMRFSEPMSHFEARVWWRMVRNGMIEGFTAFFLTEAQRQQIRFNIFYGGIQGAAWYGGDYRSHPQGGLFSFDAPEGKEWTWVILSTGYHYPILGEVLAGVAARKGDPIGTPVPLPPIEQMYVEDVIKAKDNRVAVLFSAHVGKNYGLISLVSTLYPFRGHPTEDAGAVVPMLSGDGELPVVIVDVIPDGDGDAAVVPAALALGGVLTDPIINIGEVEIDPDGDAGAVLGARGLNGTFEAAATLYDMTAMENDAAQLAVATAANGTLAVVVIVTSAYEPDTEGVRTVAALNGTLA